MRYLTLSLLGGLLLGAASPALADDSDDIWTMSFYSDSTCGESPASFGDSTTWDCYNLDSGVDLESYKWEADDCKFSAEVFTEENCGNGNNLAMSYVCTHGNELGGVTFKSFAVGGSLINNC